MIGDWADDQMNRIKYTTIKIDKISLKDIIII